MTNPEFKIYTSETVTYKVNSPAPVSELVEDLIEIGIPESKIVVIPADAVMVMFTDDNDRDLLIANEQELMLLIDVVHLTLNK